MSDWSGLPARARRCIHRRLAKLLQRCSSIIGQMWSQQDIASVQHLETFLAPPRRERQPPSRVEQELRGYLECGILA